MSSSYIVTFKKDTPEHVIQEEAQKVRDSGCTITHEYKAAIKGFAVEVPAEHVSAFSVDSPHVETVEADGEVKTQ